MATIDTDQLFQTAQELAEQRSAVLEQQKAVREVLRNLDDGGMLSEQEASLLEEIFPTRTRNRVESSEDELEQEEE